MLATLKHARRDLLSIWPEAAFSMQFSATRIFNRWFFVVNCPELVKQVLVTHHDNYQKKSPLMRNALRPLLGDGLFISDGAAWQKHRDIETPLFATEQVARYAQVMIDTTLERAHRWAERPVGSSLDVLPEMGQLTAEIICRSLFGNQLGAAQAAQVVDSFAAYQAAVEQMDLNTFLGIPAWLPNLKMWRAKAAASRIHAIVDEVIARGAMGTDDETLMAQFLKRRDKVGPEDSLTAEQIRNELIVLFMAGHETTANTLAWAWYLLSQCPDVEARLHEEVDAVFGAAEPSFAAFAKLTYTRAVIDETLRLYPPVPILSREASAADSIRNRPVPAGSIMLVAPWLLHRHKLYWDQPDSFIPERFLPDAPVKPDKYLYLPFSIGPRVCIAKFFGTVEATLCLALLARRFRLKLPAGQRVAHQCRLTLRPEGRLPMRIEPR